MIFDRHPGLYGPLRYLGKFPIYTTSILVGVHILTMVSTSLLMAFGATSLLSALTFIPSATIQRFEVWRAVTYAFVSAPSLWFVVEMFLLYVFGKEIEKSIGRKAFLAFYGVLILTIPFVLSILSFVTLIFGSETFFVVNFAGSSPVNFAVFIGFCVLYPRIQFFFGLEARWIALALLGINSLQALSIHSWESLIALWSTTLVSYFMLNTKNSLVRSALGWIKDRRLKKRFRVVPSPETSQYGDPQEEIDKLLEKISRKGIHSLTLKERERLERAREELLRKDKVL